jgi:hypothetical protein
MCTDNNGSPSSTWWRRLHCAKSCFTVTLTYKLQRSCDNGKNTTRDVKRRRDEETLLKKDEERTLEGINKINVIL